MSRRWLLLSLLALAALAGKRCADRPVVHQPGILVDKPPVQEAVPPSTFAVEDYVLTRRARFSVSARVLSTEAYWLGREADLSPRDLALGWGVMSDQAVLDRIDIRQGGRWYYTRYDAPAPASEAQIVSSSGNMHIIPARAAIERRLADLRPGQLVALEGYLVDVDHPSGWRWRTSLSRNDTGAGACEIFFVEQLTALDAR